MSKFVFVYQGGGGTPGSPAEQEKVMAEWTTWFGTIGSDLVDGGNPFSQGKKIGSDGSVGDATARAVRLQRDQCRQPRRGRRRRERLPRAVRGRHRRGVRSDRHVGYRRGR